MYSSCLKDWYDKSISFKLTCSCGNEMEGAFFKGDGIERLHCSKCEEVWEIKRPTKEKE